MKNLIIIHGSYGNPEENWFPWLKSELKDFNINIVIPKFPTPKDQNLENWNEIFNEYNNLISADTIFVGHSLGPAFIFNILENLKCPINASLLVAPFIGLLGIDEFDKVNETFVMRDFDWDKIRKNCNNFYIYHSDNDPYVPHSKSEFIANKLAAKKYEIIRNGGHLNSSSGFNEFPVLLNDIKEIINA